MGLVIWKIPFIKISFSGPGIPVTFLSKISAMKKILVAAVLLGGVTAVAFASLKNNHKKDSAVEKKMEKKQKHCSHTCSFS